VRAKMAPRHKTLVIVVTALWLLMFLYVAWAAYLKFGREPVQTDILVGSSEALIRASYGQPDSDQTGYHSLGLSAPPTLPPGPIRTLIFSPGGLWHPEGGTLWVWLTQRNGEWECFESCWFADDVVF
jgi:hypothetical protein